MTLKRSFSHVGAITNSEGLLKMIKSFLEANEVERSTRIWGIINLFEEKQLKGWSDLPKTLIYHEVFEIFEIISTLGHICPKMILEAISKDHVNELSGKNQKEDISHFLSLQSQRCSSRNRLSRNSQNGYLQKRARVCKMRRKIGTVKKSIDI